MIFIVWTHYNNYLLIWAKVTAKQCPGPILISKWCDSKMQSASCVSVKWKPSNCRVATWDTANLRVVSYNSVLWVASCELIIKLRVGSRINLHNVKPALLVYIIFSSLHVKQSKNNKVVWYIPIMIYTWEQL